MPKRIISSANLLLMFEAAGRLGSFSRAALEMEISQPAISHAIKNLEQQLGTPLFERQHRGVRLNKVGLTFYAQVSGSLNDIYRAADEIKHQHNNTQVTLSVSTAFATHWLLPKIAKFNQRYPEIDLRCLTTNSDTDFNLDEADLRLPLGGGDWPNHKRWHFTDEIVCVVCSPQYLEQAGGLHAPSDLLHHTLIHLDANYPQRMDWNGWLKHYALDLGVSTKQIHFNDYSIVVQAALEGQGVALGWRHIIEPLIEQGRLIEVLPDELMTDNPFYLIAPKDIPLSPAATKIRNWLIAQVKKA